MKKALILLLAITMLLPVLFASCAEGNPDEEVHSTEAKSEETVENHDVDDLGEVDLGGRDITIISRVESVNQSEVYVEEMDSDPINDAVYNRNLALEERLKCHIEVIQHLPEPGSIAGEVVDAVSNMVIAGGTDYNIVANASYTSMTLAMQGRMTDLRTTAYIDYDKNYWSQGFNDALSYRDSQFFVTGPMSLSYYRYMFVTMFNKRLLEDEGMGEELYEVVENGEWTIDYMTSIAERFYQDLNGSGSRDGADLYGFCARIGPTSSMMDGFWEGSDICILKKDADNVYTYEIDGERVSNSLDAVLRLLNSSGSFTATTNAGDADVLIKFAQDEAAMITYRLIAVEDPTIRNMTNDYGILPVPKLTESQDYRTHVQVEVILYGVPSTCYDQIDDLGIFLEAYASESYNRVKPAYYEVALTSKYVKDPQSVDMLDRIVHSVAIDPVNLFSVSFSFGSANVRAIHESGTNTVNSMLRRNESSVKKSVKKINEAFDEVIDQQGE